MIRVKAKNLHTNEEEIYYLSSSIDLEAFKENINYIKHGTRGNWIRPNREVLEIIDNHKPVFRNEMKYICMQTESGNQEVVIFNKSINHDFMYEAVQYVSEEFRKRLSAGFTDGLSFYGRSETLNLDSNPEHFSLVQ